MLTGLAPVHRQEPLPATGKHFRRSCALAQVDCSSQSGLRLLVGTKGQGATGLLAIYGRPDRGRQVHFLCKADLSPRRKLAANLRVPPSHRPDRAPARCQRGRPALKPAGAGRLGSALCRSGAPHCARHLLKGATASSSCAPEQRSYICQDSGSSPASAFNRSPLLQDTTHRCREACSALLRFHLSYR